MRKSVIVIGGVILLSAVAYYATASLKTPPEQPPHASTFADIDNFKQSLSGDLKQHPESFSLAEAAKNLGAFRLKGGFAVCTNKAEIEAKQYVEFSGFMNKLAGSPALTRELNSMLDSDLGVTDCQFRVTEVLVKHAQAK